MKVGSESRLGKSYVALAVLAILASFFATAIEFEFLRSWSNGGIMYLPPSINAVATGVILVGLLLALYRTRDALHLIAASSLAVVAAVVIFLAEIAPIAQGNNDSGEVFWIVVLPILVPLASTYVSYRKLTDLRTLR